MTQYATDPQSERPSDSRAPSDPRAWTGWLLTVGFSCIAVALFASSGGNEIPLSPPHSVAREALTVGSKRAAMTDPAHLVVEGLNQNCNGCHQIFQSSQAYQSGQPGGAALDYHQDVRLQHGLNDRCINCHDSKDRERLTLRDGATVEFADTPRLCAQCHGTVYRDWQRGTHGKTLGSWMTNSAAQRRLSCNECHDPHSPRYELYAPLPGPQTLRMGDQSRDADLNHAEKQSPLQRWLNHSNDGAHP